MSAFSASCGNDVPERCPMFSCGFSHPWPPPPYLSVRQRSGVGGTNPHTWVPATALHVSTWPPQSPSHWKVKGLLCVFSEFLAPLHQDRGRETPQGSIIDINDIEGNDAKCVKDFYLPQWSMSMPWATHMWTVTNAETDLQMDAKLTYPQGNTCILLIESWLKSLPTFGLEQ